MEDRRSYWCLGEQAPRPGFDPPLNSDLDVDIVIVGGGITGLTAAYQAQRAGLRVAVLENTQVGRGVTRDTTAHLTAILDCEMKELVSRFGEEDATRAIGAGMEAIERIEQLAS